MTSDIDPQIKISRSKLSSP